MGRALTPAQPLCSPRYDMDRSPGHGSQTGALLHLWIYERTNRQPSSTHRRLSSVCPCENDALPPPRRRAAPARMRDVPRQDANQNLRLRDPRRMQHRKKTRRDRGMLVVPGLLRVSAGSMSWGGGWAGSRGKRDASRLETAAGRGRMAGAKTNVAGRPFRCGGWRKITRA